MLICHKTPKKQPRIHMYAYILHFTQFLPGSGCIDTAIWMHYMDAKKRLEKKLDGYYTRMLRAILNKSWRHQLYGHLPPITKTIQVRRTRHAGHCWRSKDELVSDVYTYGPPHIAKQKQDDQPELTYSSYVRTKDVTLKTCRRRRIIGRSGERGSGISVLAARHDDDDDDDMIHRLMKIERARKRDRD